MQATFTVKIHDEHQVAISRSELVILFLVGLAAAWVCGFFQTSPGYMDADYYYVMGRELAAGNGWWEPFLWNYLDNPTSLPHPAFVYWMPLASIIAASGMRLFGALSFENAQLPFLLLAGFVPVMTGLIGWRLTGNRSIGRLAGFLAAFPGIYLPLMTTTEIFVPVMLLGGGWFLAAWSLVGHRHPAKPYALLVSLGLIAALMHLSRADGLLWLGMSGLVVLSNRWQNYRRITHHFVLSTILYGTIVLFVYLLLMSPWYSRNLQIFGLPFSPAGGRAFFITTYNEQYSFPADQLNLGHWLHQPLGAHLQGIGAAFLLNIGNLLGTQSGIFMLPLMVISAWKRRGEARIRWFFVALGIVWFVMTLIFPYAGSRGGLLHSAAALQPVAWVLAADGLWRVITWAQGKRGWKFNQAWTVFSVAAVIFQLGLSAYALSQVIGLDFQLTRWDKEARDYAQVETALVEIGASPDDLVLTNNPPGYFAATGRGGISIPNGPIDRAMAAGKTYGARYLILQEEQGNLAELYENPSDLAGLDYIATAGTIHIFKLSGDK